MAVSYTSGLNFDAPSKGDTDWDETEQAKDAKVSAHDHTGGGKGLPIETAAISANAVDSTKIRLANNTALRGRNAAGSADVDMFKLNTADVMELIQGPVTLTNVTAPATPASGRATAYIDSTTKMLSVKDDAGYVRSLGRTNFSITSQAINPALRTYITGSALAMPTNKMQVGTCFRWVFDMTKTAAGAAASTFDICFGINGATGDTARVSFTKPAGTGVIDTARVSIEAICRGPLSASGVVAGMFQLTHNLAATGHAVIPCVNVTTVSSGFDVTTANLIAGLCITSGASDAITIQCVTAEAWNL